MANEFADHRLHLIKSSQGTILSINSVNYPLYFFQRDFFHAHCAYFWNILSIEIHLFHNTMITTMMISDNISLILLFYSIIHMISLHCSYLSIIL